MIKSDHQAHYSVKRNLIPVHFKTLKLECPPGASKGARARARDRAWARVRARAMGQRASQLPIGLGAS